MGDCLRKEIVGLRKRSHAMAVQCGTKWHEINEFYMLNGVDGGA